MAEHQARPEPGADVGILVTIRSLLPNLAPVERRVAQAVLDDPQGVAWRSISELARTCGTSATSVVRFCRAVGLRGYPDLRLALAGAVARDDDAAAVAAGNRIRWAIGARSAGAIGGTVGTGAFPDSTVIAMLLSYREGQLSLDDLSLEFRARRWPRVPDVCPPELEPAREAIDDPEPYVPGSFDDVVLAYDLGWLTDADYNILAIAADGLAGS